ncbi:Retrovirus-related Pol polyprotein LINE-1 [Gossypium australe]|uniref:Retrovirus-related Pol polyprotein LINE-1 n=1 Tax=Gossypium australe TaxID=47621 RepID=A0A5B6W8E5_9ROSI|nr:Retrovirus-related Pol polyprotein LINE-1 [Gossypium australe]
MEWLEHHFHTAILTGEWCSNRLSHTRPNLSHLFFAEDLVIFSKAYLKHSGLLKNFLGKFCELSGHKVNARKINVFFSFGVKENLRKDINNFLGFQEVHDWGHYLGVPLFHQRVTNNTLYFLVERVRNHLSSWDAKKISFVGKVTLAQTFLCNRLWFLKRKMALVGWDNICQLRSHGGLGIMRLGD